MFRPIALNRFYFSYPNGYARVMFSNEIRIGRIDLISDDRSSTEKISKKRNRRVFFLESNESFGLGSTYSTVPFTPQRPTRRAKTHTAALFGTDVARCSFFYSFVDNFFLCSKKKIKKIGIYKSNNVFIGRSLRVRARRCSW